MWKYFIEDLTIFDTFFHRARSFLVKSNNRDWHLLQDDTQLIQKHLSYLGFSSVNLRKHSHFLCIESPKWNRILGIRVVKGIINMTFFFRVTYMEWIIGRWTKYWGDCNSWISKWKRSVCCFVYSTKTIILVVEIYMLCCFIKTIILVFEILKCEWNAWKYVLKNRIVINGK